MNISEPAFTIRLKIYQVIPSSTKSHQKKKLEKFTEGKLINYVKIIKNMTCITPYCHGNEMNQQKFSKNLKNV